MDALLPHTEYNSQAKATIILVHGAFSSRDEWDLVTPHLKDEYHLLLPDLPGHGKSRGMAPFSKQTASAMLARLIREKAHNSKAHVIGLSLGAHVAIDLASCYPEVVDSVFVSGFVQLSPSLSPYLPYGIWLMIRSENVVPRRLVSWLMDGADSGDGAESESTPCTLALCRAVVDAQSGSKWPSSWPAKTLIVAAIKRGIVPSDDSPQDAKRLAEIGRQSNEGTFAVSHADMRHPWNRQAPLLFAESAKAWFERKEISPGFKRL